MSGDNMIMSFRWYVEDFDSVTLAQIRQIPGVKGVVASLYDIPVGEEWPFDRILKMKKKIEDKGLKLVAIESVNVHEDIKLGLQSRDKYIENYKRTIENIGKAGIPVICYNFMPVFDWFRTDLEKPINDGSRVLAYDHEMINKMNPYLMLEEVQTKSNGYVLPGWEPERLAYLKDLLKKYEGFTEEMLWENLEYFLRAIIPTAEKYNVKMAIHPDDPPWPVFGLPRIIKDKESLERLINIVDSPSNCITLCSGSLGADVRNDIPEMIRYFGKKGRIAFGHVRNIKIEGEKKFYESSHLSSDGSLDMFEIMKTYHDIGFDGPIRPDHGRMIWGEKARPGYGLYDRALGAAYLNGLWEAIGKMKNL